VLLITYKYPESIQYTNNIIFIYVYDRHPIFNIFIYLVVQTKIGNIKLKQECPIYLNTRTLKNTRKRVSRPKRKNATVPKPPNKNTVPTILDIENTKK